MGDKEMIHCQEARNAITIMDAVCPNCGEIVEIFVKDGAVCTDSACAQCGSVIAQSTSMGDLKCG